VVVEKYHTNECWRCYICLIIETWSIEGEASWEKRKYYRNQPKTLGVLKSTTFGMTYGDAKPQIQNWLFVEKIIEGWSWDGNNCVSSRWEKVEGTTTREWSISKHQTIGWSSRSMWFYKVRSWKQEEITLGEV